MSHPEPPVDGEEVKGRAILVAHRLDVGDAIEVELAATVGPPRESLATRLVEGTVLGATSRVLLVEAKAGRRLTRIPWASILTIRDAVAPHPAL